METTQHTLDIALERAEAHFGRQTRFSERPALDQLISTILSQRTTYANEKKAFDRMWTAHGSWEQIMEASLDELTELISSSNYPEVKAPRIQQILRQIWHEHGAFDLSFLGDIPLVEAIDWLMALPGVGHKTSTFVMLFTFRKPVLPVDTHVHRVSQRLGIIGPKVTEARAHKILLDMLTADAHELLNFHKLFFKHGQRICTWNHPKCQQCYLTDVCDFYQQQKEAK
ncbi:MAG: endonuclease III domain-containing protein [Cyclobacteriaceae bacterium]